MTRVTDGDKAVNWFAGIWLAFGDHVGEEGEVMRRVLYLSTCDESHKMMASSRYTDGFSTKRIELIMRGVFGP